MLLTSPGIAQDATEGEELYARFCASCHGATGLGIPGAFPPLADNPKALDAEYVATVIMNGRSGPLEVDGVTYDATMPALTSLDDADIANVVAFLDTNFAGAATPPTTTPPAGSGDAGRGEALFLGSRDFENGATACAACHTAGERGSLGGPSMGPDLTNVLVAYGGEAGLSGVLAAPAFPVMQELYADTPLTAQERADLAAYFNEQSTKEDRDRGDALFVIGLVGAGVLFGGMFVLKPFTGAGYSRRLRRNA
jgi:mono/diheme cytochrome c family protein